MLTIAEVDLIVAERLSRTRRIQLMQTPVSHTLEEQELLLTFPGQSRHFTRHSNGCPGATRRRMMSNLSSGYLACISATASSIH